MNTQSHVTAAHTTSAILPGTVADRETVEGWRQWRLHRHDFVPAPRLDVAAYRLLSPRDRQLHDLHRAATHANLPLLETPMSRVVAKVMRSRLQTNALKHRPTTRPGLMITGGGYQGKTETACVIAAAFEDAWLALHNQLNPNALPGARDLHAPVAYVQTPVTAKPKSTCQAILDFFGAPHKRMSLPQLTHAVRNSLRDHGNRVLLLDDITRLKMHRADDQDTLDLMRAFMSMHTTLVLIGVNIPGSGLLREGRHDPRTGQWVLPPSSVTFDDDPSTQTERRFDLLHLRPFSYDTAESTAAWTAHLTGLEQHLRLLGGTPGMLTGGAMPEYLFRRTSGVVGLLERLIEEGCAEAMDTGLERLTEDLLDTILIDLGNDPNRDPTAGEIPTVPAVPAVPKVNRPNPAQVPEHRFRSTTSRIRMTGVSEPRPFPRSLDPLPEESLTGYVMRLAHRLDLPVNHVAWLGGLSADERHSLPVKHLVELPADHAARFAAMTRLTAAEVTALTLADLATRYPPLAQHDQPHRADHHQPRPRGGGFAGKTGWGWFGPGTRFCPECPAGDTSPIQTAHGGAWRKHWRLIVVFACPLHQQLLRSACPRCHLPPQQARAGHGILRHNPEPLHPAECRTKTSHDYRTPHCGVRLDQLHTDPNGPAPEAIEHLLRVQQRLLGHLDPLPTSLPNIPSNEAGREAGGQATAWFHDLRLGMGLIRASWPAANSLAPGWIDLDAIEGHIKGQEREQAQSRDAGKRSKDAAVFGGPPEDTAACANLLALVEHVLTNDGTAPSSDILDQLCAAAQGRPGWGRYLGTHTASNSPWLQAALAPHISRHLPRRPRGLPRELRGVPLPPPVRRARELQPHHLGHRLPPHVVAPLLDVTGTALPARDAHRYLIIRLVQAVLGCDMITAAGEVDLPVEAAQPSCWRVHRWAEHHNRQADLAVAIDLAAAAFAQHTPMIDYQHRRDELRDWILPVEVWNERVLPLHGTFRHHPAIPLDNQKRIIASILIWQDITAGDTAACPLYQNRKRLVPTESAKFGIRILQTIGTLDRIRQQHSTRHYMLTVLDALANYREHLGDNIDRRTPHRDRASPLSAYV